MTTAWIELAARLPGSRLPMIVIAQCGCAAAVSASTPAERRSARKALRRSHRAANLDDNLLAPVLAQLTAKASADEVRAASYRYLAAVAASLDD